MNEQLIKELSMMLEILDIIREKSEVEMILAVDERNTNRVDTLLKAQSFIDECIDTTQDMIIDLRLADPDEEWIDEPESYIAFLEEELGNLGF